MGFETIIKKFANICEILQIPSGARLKISEPSFNLADLRLCVRLRNAGVNPDCIFDVGANIGQFSLSATTVWPMARIISYEPVAESFDQLKSVAKNHPKIEPIASALGSESGESEIRVTSQTQSSSLRKLHSNHLQAYPHVTERKKQIVEIRTLEDEVGRLKPTGKVLLKLDVQGFESEVIRGGAEALGVFHWIVLETATRPMYEGEVLFDEIKLLMLEKGFRFETPMDIHFAPDGSPGQFDALFAKF